MSNVVQNSPHGWEANPVHDEQSGVLLIHVLFCTPLGVDPSAAQTSGDHEDHVAGTK